MANSPDVRRYVDLTVLDEDPVTVINNMLETGKGLLPEWIPQAGQIEVVLTELFALRSAELNSAINRVPSATVEVLLQLFGLSRSDGVKAVADVTITFSDISTTRIIPAGTQFLFNNLVTGVSYIFTLDEDFSSTTHGISGNASITAESVGTLYNFSAVGSFLSMLSNSSFVESVVFSSPSSGGENSESDSQFFSRGTSLLSSYTTALTTASQIKFYVGSSIPYVNRVEVFNRRRYRNRDTTSTSYGYHDGSVLVVVGGTVSDVSLASSQLPVSTSNLSSLYNILDERTPTGLTIDVMSAELASVDITATVYKKPNSITSTVNTDIVNALQTYLNPNSWLFDSGVVRRNEIISIIDSVLDVDYVDSLVMNGKTLIGSDNVGYYGLGGGSQASFTIDVSTSALNTLFDDGQASIYYVDSSVGSDVPTVYMFNNLSFTTDGSGDATVTFIAASDGINFNDVSNLGKVVPGTNGANLVPVAGDWAGAGTVSFDSGGVSPVISGGSNDVSTFVPLDSSVDDGVSTDIVLRNLGTVVTAGTISIQVL